MALVAFYYRIEFAQAVFFLVFPMSIVGALSVRIARKVQAKGLVEDALIRQLLRHRFVTQLIGVVSIFLTAMYGMYVNLYTGPF